MCHVASLWLLLMLCKSQCLVMTRQHAHAIAEHNTVYTYKAVQYMSNADQALMSKYTLPLGWEENSEHLLKFGT